MSNIEFEDDVPLNEENKEKTTDKSASFCRTCKYPILEEDRGVCPRCGTKQEVVAHEVSDKRFPRWSRSNVLVPLKSMGLKIWQEIALAVVSLVFLTLFSLLVSLIFEAGFDQETLNNNPNLFNGLLNLIVYVLVLICSLCLLIPNFKAYLQSFFGKGIHNRTFKTGLTFFLIMFAFSIVWGLVTTLVYNLTGIGDATNANQSGIEQLINSPYWWTIMIATCFIAPITEELGYRAGLFALLKRYNRVLAYIVCALVFGFIHFDFTVFADIGENGVNLIIEFMSLPSYIGAGVILCFAYEEWGIGASTVAHMINNIVSFLLVLSTSLVPSESVFLL